MSKLGKKVAYLKGLAEGMGVKDDNDQGKLMLALIDVLEAVARENEELSERVDELSEYVDEIDCDVSEIEEALFDAAEDEDEDDEYFDEDDEDDEDDGLEDCELIEYECPHCGTTVFFDEEAFDMEEEHLCPNCHRKVFVEEDEDDEE